MKKFSLIVGTALLISAALAVGVSQTQALAEGGQKPYKANGPEYVLQEGPHPDCGSGRLKVEVQGSGQGTHTGQYTIVRQHCFNLATAAIEDGHFEQTAANGDKLWGTYSGTPAGVLEFDEYGNPVVIIFDSPWRITGGTGRFADAEGYGDTRGIFNIVTKVGDFSMDGWISYSAAQ
jgi:hypothetical protein